MVQGKKVEDAKGLAEWFDIRGNANDKFVKEQAEFLKEKITEKLRVDSKLADDIYVITPFRNVARKLANELNTMYFTKYENNKPMNVGRYIHFKEKRQKSFTLY